MDKEQLLSAEHQILDKLESISANVVSLHDVTLQEAIGAIKKLSLDLEDALTLVTNKFAELKNGVN